MSTVQNDPETDQAATESGAPVLLRPRDPLIFRDARPFAADPGARAFSLTWPLPRTTAGALRTHVINAGSTGPPDWNGDNEAAKAAATRARRIAVHGPLLAARFPGDDPAWHAYVPAPADLVPFRETVTENGVERPSRDLSFMCLRPEAPAKDEGCDLPRLSEANGNGKQAAMKNVALRPMRISDEVKPDKEVPGWWSLGQATRWLAMPHTDEPAIRCALTITMPDKDELLNGIGTLPEDARVHVSIDSDTQTNVDGALFSTEARAFRDAPRRGVANAGAMLGADYRAKTDEPAIGILCNVHADEEWDRDPALLPLGGERRLTRIESNPAAAAWPEPANVPAAKTLEAATRLRLQLVTPAIFAHGWLPGWMADGTPPGLGKLKLQFRLVGVASGQRRVPVSGWRLSRRGDAPPGPRATVYAVPAGAVYFFEVTGTLTDEIWRKLWLQPVSDNGRHRDEGFGLVLPGLW